MGPRPFGPKIDGLLVSPGKAYTLLPDQLGSESAQEKWFQVNSSIHIILFGLLGWLNYSFIILYQIPIVIIITSYGLDNPS